MAYTFSTKPSPTYASTGELDNFGNFVTAGAHTAIDAGAGIQTSDATGTPVTSPVALTTATKLINIPPNASKLNFIASSGVSFSELSAFSNSVAVPASLLVTVEVTRQTTIYFQATTTANLSFWFTII